MFTSTSEREMLDQSGPVGGFRVRGRPNSPQGGYKQVYRARAPVISGPCPYLGGFLEPRAVVCL